MTVLTFAMGEYEARFPDDRLYSHHHMWALPGGGDIRFGFTAYAERLLRDIYFVTWCVPEPSTVSARQQLGSIESKKAESDLYAPIAGTLTRFNQELMQDPSIINRDMYGAGWLFEMEAEQNDLMAVEAYLDHLSEVWKVTQRILKGQA